MPSICRRIVTLVGLSALMLSLSAPAATPPAVGPRHPGKFIWFNLATPDEASAQAFYGAVFGWKFSAPPAGERFTLIKHHGHDIGSLVVPDASATVKGARWVSLFSVADAAAVARRATEHGGAILVPPTKIAQHGTHALLRDADGALFGVLQLDSGDPVDKLQENEFFWADLLAPDPAKAAEFYRVVADYAVSQVHLGTGIDRVVLSSGSIKRAGIAPLPKEMKQAGWLPYVVVGDVSATLAQVTKSGGRVLLAPSAELLDGNLAVFADPVGGVLGIVKWAPPAKNKHSP